MPNSRVWRSPHVRTPAAAAVAAAAAAVVVGVLVTPGSADARRTTSQTATRVIASASHGQAANVAAGRRAHAVPAPPKHPTRARQIQNIDQVKAAIKAYYGNAVSGTNPDGSRRHVPAANGAYAKEVSRLVSAAERFLGRAAHRHYAHRRAIVLDVDDTSLNTYNYEIDANFVYRAASSARFIRAQAFPAVPRMPALARYARSHGYAIFFLTGRAEPLRAATERNLAKVGFPSVPNRRVFLKDQSRAWLASCSPRCTTIQYKSLTRKHIQSLGFTIVANFGDQYSDLKGGYAKKRFKLPNPMYYLP